MAESRAGFRDSFRDVFGESRRGRLDTPRETRRQLVRRPARDTDRFGVFAEQFARFMGTARFLIYMSGFVAAWLSALASVSWMVSWLQRRGLEVFGWWRLAAAAVVLVLMLTHRL